MSNEKQSPTAEFMAIAKGMYDSKRLNQFIGSVVLFALLAISFFCGAFWENQTANDATKNEIVSQLHQLNQTMTATSELVKQSAHTHLN